MNLGNPLYIGEALREALTAASAVTKIVGSHIYPYTTKVEINQPHVVYDNISINYDATKDGLDPSSVDVTLHANASSYPVSRDLASAIVDTLLESDRLASLVVDCDFNDAANMYVHNIQIQIQL